MPLVMNPSGTIFKVEQSNDAYRRALAGELGWTIITEGAVSLDEGGASAPPDSGLSSDVEGLPPPIVKRKRGRPRKHPLPEAE